MKLSIELQEPKAALLTNSAQELGIEPDSLVHAILIEQLEANKEDFLVAAKSTLKKNTDLYKRLS